MIQLPKDRLYNVVVVGGGATGSQLLPFLTQLMANLEGHCLKIVDGDIYEKKNTVNQKCTHLDENKPKARVLGTRYKRVYPELNISYVDSYIKSEEQLIDYLEKNIAYNKNYMPVLVGCVDNNATRKLFDNVFKRMNEIIYIDSGNGTIDRIGQTVVGYKSVFRDENFVDHSNLILPPVSSLFPDILEEKDSIDKALSCATVVDEHPQNIATNTLAATNLFLTLTNILKFDKIQAHVSYFDADKQELISREAVEPCL